MQNLVLDWSTLSIQNLPTVNGHVECQFNAATQSWTTPRMVTDPYLRVHGLCPGLNYGQQVYEGLKAFRTLNNTIHVFRPAAHAQRLRHSAGLVCLPQVPDSLFYECVRLVVASNAEFVPPATSQSFLYIRPILFGSGPQMALAPPNEFTLAMYVGPSLPYHGNMAIDALILDDFDRAAPRGTGSGKVGGNYAPVWPHQMKAKSQGFGVTLHLDSDTRTFVEEFSTSGFIGIDKTRTLYIPDAPNAINSITSDSLATISESMQIKVKREKVTRFSLFCSWLLRLAPDPILEYWAIFRGACCRDCGERCTHSFNYPYCH
jgi:branched-chain amino acid aminotransferase